MSERLCACGHVENFHAPGLGCSGSHSDSMPCAHYAPPWRGADLDAVRRLSYENARGCREMGLALVALREVNGLTRRDVEERMGWWPGQASQFEGDPTAMNLKALRAYASAVGARLTFTVEADPDVDATA